MRYQWAVGQSPLQEIVVTGGKKSPVEALIYAPADAAAVAGLDQLLASKGMAVSYDVVDNRAVLRVGGFGEEQALLDLLKQNNFIGGEAKTEAVESKRTPFNTFMGAAVFYQLGNLTGWFGNFLRKDSAGMESDTAFIIGDTSMLLFGRKSMEEKQIALMQGFGNALKKNGVTIEAGSAFAPHHTQDLPSVWNTVRRTMTNWVVGIKAASEVAAGYKKIHAGINQGNSAKVMAGSLIAGGFGAGALIPEKTLSELRDEYGAKNDDELKARISELPFFKRILVSIQRTPLLLSGTFSGLNNLFCIFGAIDEKQYIGKTGESRKQTELKAKLGDTSTPSYKKSLFGLNLFGLKETEVTINDSGPDPKCWTAGKTLDHATAEYAGNTNPTKEAKLLAAKHTAEKNILDLQTDQDRLKSGRFGTDPKKLWIFDLVQSIFFLVGNYFYANSPKGGNMFDRIKLSERFFAAAASQIATAPADQRDYLFAAACQYAGDTRDLGVTVREAQKIISDKLRQVEANPWLKASREAANTPPLIVEERADHPSVVNAKGIPPELLDMKEREDRVPEKSFAANMQKQERPQAPVSLIDRALMEAPAASHAIH